MTGRRLDRQNATSAVLAHDFDRFQLELWPALVDVPAKARESLDEMMTIRNAIAHQDVSRLARLRLDLPVLRAGGRCSMSSPTPWTPLWPSGSSR